jgi:hypothetical protein
MLLSVEFNQVGLIYGSDTESTLHSRNERWALKDGAGEALEGLWDQKWLRLKHLHELGLAFDRIVKPNDSNVLLSGGLLGLHHASCSFDADNEASSDLRVESTGMASLLNSQDSTNPSNDFMGRWVGWLVKIDNSVSVWLRMISVQQKPDIFKERPLQRGIAMRKRKKMPCADVQPVVIFEK